MAERTKRELMRLVRGELPPERAAALRAELERDPEQRRELERLRTVWEGLALPEPAAAPAGFTARIVARARGERERPTGLGLAGAPAWAKLAAGLALVAGLAIGSGLAVRSGLAATSADDAATAGWSAAEPTLAESYASALADDARDATATDPGADR